MKKLLLITLLLLSTAAFAHNPPVVIGKNEQFNLIYVYVENDTGVDLTCSYNVSWLEQDISRDEAGVPKTQSGHMKIDYHGAAGLTYSYDPSVKISQLKAVFDCDADTDY